MPYEVRYRLSARAAWNARAARYGASFRDAVEAWLRRLADEAETGAWVLSADAKEFLESLGSDTIDVLPNSGIDRWLSTGLWDKVRALLEVLRHRRDPWEFRMAMEVFLIPNAATDTPSESPVVVSAFYEVEHLHRRIVVSAFPELPDPWPFEQDYVLEA